MVDLGGRESLTARQLKLIESICYAEMMEEGYRPERASRPWNPHAFFILYAQLMDAGHALRAYARGRGWRAAAEYKMRQWFGSRL
jgi:hypothetical protein